MITKNESEIVNAIKSAEEITDPVDELLEQSKTDPGMPFSEDNIQLLRTLYASNRPKYENIRTLLSQTGVRVGALEKIVCRNIHVRGDGTTTKGFEWKEVKLWDKPVDGAQLLNELSSTILRYMVLPANAAHAMALWVMFAHSHNLWRISPRMAFVSPEKRCGKTTALSILQHLVPKPLPTSNITAAAVFRTIEAHSPTLLIDEADTFLRGKDDLRGIMNSGHMQSMAFVVRTSGDNYEPTKFSTWAPMVIAMIGKLPNTLDDRSITISLRRKLTTERVERFRYDHTDNLETLRSKIMRWVKDNKQNFVTGDKDSPEGLHDRAADNWRPLLAIADIAGGHWPTLARQAATSLTKTEDDSYAVLLLNDIRRLFMDAGQDRLQTSNILEQLHQMDDRPWPEWRQGKAITARQISKLLQSFGVKSQTIRSGGKDTAKGYMLRAFDDAFARYLPDFAVTPSQPNNSAGNDANQSVTSEKVVTDKIPQNTSKSATCDGVTGKLANCSDPNEIFPEMPEFLDRRKTKPLNRDCEN